MVLRIDTEDCAVVSFMVVPSLSDSMIDVLLLCSVAFIIIVWVLVSTLMSWVLFCPSIVRISVAFDDFTSIPVVKLLSLHPSIVMFCLPVVLIPVPVADPLNVHPPVQLISRLSAVIVAPFSGQCRSLTIIAWRLMVFEQLMTWWFWIISSSTTDTPNSVELITVLLDKVVFVRLEFMAMLPLASVEKVTVEFVAFDHSILEPVSVVSIV